MGWAHWRRGHWRIPLTGGSGAVLAPAVAVADARTGGAFTATLTGGEPAGLNTLYRAQFTGGAGPLSWVAAGTRTGPGTITGTVPPGFYLWAASTSYLGSQSWSAPAFYPVTNAAVALHEQIMVAALAQLQLALTDLVPPANCRRMKLRKPEFVLKNLPLPAALLITFGQSEEFVGGTNGLDDTVFPAFFAYLTRNLWSDPTTEAADLLVRERVRRAFRSQRRPGVAEVMNCDVGPGPVFTVGVTDQQDVEMGTMLLKFKAREPRGLGV